MRSIATAPDRAYLQLLEDVRFDPVFIIGDHRSGTTVLYSLLAATGVFNVVTAYHVIRYGEILSNHVEGRTDEATRALADRFASLGLDTRIIDGVGVSPGLPEEYGFAIDDSSRPRLRPRTLPAFVELCRKIRYTGEDRPVLLKNPWDVFGFAYIHAAFPRARFIFVHRHPAHVMSSQLSAMRSLYSERNEYVAMLSGWYRKLFDQPAALRFARVLGTARFGVGARIVGRHVTKVARYHGDHIAMLPSHAYVEIRYEDLCDCPDGTLQRILQFLGLQAANVINASGVVQPRRSKILPEVAARYRQIRQSLQPYLAAHGYDVEL